jgi:catechol O-methyltransferase
MTTATSTELVTQDERKQMFDSRSALKDYVLANGRRGDIKNIIDTIDKYGWTKQWLMNVGDRKGAILDQAIQIRKPKTVLELGIILLLL